MRLVGLILGLLIALASPASAQVTLDAAATLYIDSITAVTSLSLTTLTVGSSPNTILIAQTGNFVPTSCHWDPTGANQALSNVINQSTNVALWALLNPTPGNKTLTCALTSKAYVSLNAVSFKGVDTSSLLNAIDATNTATGSSGTAAVTVSAPANGMAIDVALNGNSFSLPTQTQAFIDNTIATAGSYGTTSGSSVAFSWTVSPSTPWKEAAVSLSPHIVATGHNATLLGVGN